MYKFPADIPKSKVIKVLQLLGFTIIREKEHISMLRVNEDGTKTPLTMPNHLKIKGTTLRAICSQVGISREQFMNIFQSL
jgi:predicted RNA binding protein YcfA (HicA-like mRNA interferase family)